MSSIYLNAKKVTKWGFWLEKSIEGLTKKPIKSFCIVKDYEIVENLNGVKVRLFNNVKIL